MATLENFDLVVIGGGPAGYTGAIRAAQLGFKVACVEKGPTLGGTCLNVGCIPSKALLESSEHYYQAKTKLSKHGVMIGDLKLDLATMLKRKESVVRQLTGGIAMLFKKNKIEWVQGHGKIAKKDGENFVVEVGGDKPRTLSAKKILLATGSEPTALPFLPFDEKRVVSSTGALSISEVPKHLVVIGGGVIGLELGSVWLRLGSRVTVVEFLDRLIAPFDHQVGDELKKALIKQGMEFRLGTKCLGATSDKNNGMVVSVEEIKTATKSQIECDYILVATGRRPYSANLGLENVDLTVNKFGRVEIDTHFQTTTVGIYAVGDLVDGPMLAHKAEDEAVAAVEIMAGQHGHVNYDAIPNVIYTWPELASVGATEEEVKARGVQYKVGTFPFIANARAKTMDETEGFVKIIADATTDRVLGVHIVGPRASDMIPEAAATMEFGGSAEDIARTCHAHPTLSESVKEAAMAVDKRTINF
jgi:dihydrolipoamide dehydrogenase